MSGLELVKESDLIENVDVRKQMMGKIEVLERVKGLILLPNTELMTTKMVAEWYEVNQDAIRKTTERNKEELIQNGMMFKKYSEIKGLVNSDNMSQLRISRQGTNVFSKRAVLNIGMLLRDSGVAKRVRSALLDQQEVISDEQKTLHIDKEKEIALKIMFAPTEGEKLLAFNEYNSYKNRHIKQLEDTIEEQRPKVDTYDKFMDGSDFKTMLEVSKSLGIGRNKLYAFLREQKVLMKDNLPYQRFVNSGYFTVKTYPLQRGFQIINNSQTFVTAKGMEFINRLLEKHSIPRLIK